MYDKIKEGEKYWDKDKDQFVTVLYVRNIIDVRASDHNPTSLSSGIYGVQNDEAVNGRLEKI